MTLLGKSFSVVILILSLTFMVLALAVNASHRNWRDVVLGDGGMKQQIEDASEVNEQLRDGKSRIQANLDREKVARATALAAMQTKLTSLQGALTAAQASVQDLRSQNNELGLANKSRAQELDALTDETVKLRAQIRTEQQNRDELFTETLALNDKVNSMRGVVQIQQERNDQLMAQVTRFKEVIDANGINMNDPLDGAPPKRNGVVLVVNRSERLVEISIGHDEGLRPGHELEVSRNNRYVTKLKVRYTEPDRAVAEIMTDYSEGIIQERDRVDTTF